MEAVLSKEQEICEKNLQMELQRESFIRQQNEKQRRHQLHQRAVQLEKQIKELRPELISQIKENTNMWLINNETSLPFVEVTI